MLVFECAQRLSLTSPAALECHDLLTRLLDPSPTKRITMQEILRHPFLVRQSGPIALTPYKPHGDTKDLNRNIIRYLAFK